MNRNIILILIVLLILLVIPVIAQGEKDLDSNQGESIPLPSDAVPPPGIDGDEFVKPADKILKEELNELQYKVTQKEGTEAPFRNEYWDNHEDGIYVDIVSGEPLFSSKDKFESGTGWPSFTRPIADGNINELVDTTLGMRRVEVRSFFADSHLGHLFNDGPAPSGLRYCINSASLRFIPVSELEKEGYGRFLPMFDGSGS